MYFLLLWIFCLFRVRRFLPDLNQIGIPQVINYNVLTPPLNLRIYVLIRSIYC